MEKDEVAYQLGKIHGVLTGMQRTQEEQGKTIAGVNNRLTNIEISALKKGSAAGSAGGGLVAVFIEILKVKTGIGGG